MKEIVPPTALIGSFSGIVPPAKGGTGGDTPLNARTSLGLLDKNLIGAASGPVPLDGSGKVSSALLSSSLVQPPTIALIGDSTLPILAYAVNSYKITNYDSRITYNVSASEGSVSILLDTITYTSPAAASATSGFTINGNAFVIPTLTSAPNQPSVGVPVASSAVYGPTIYPTTSAFVSFIPSDTHASSDWQIASDAAFTTLLASSTTDTVNKVSWSAANLPVNSTLYLRVRHTGTSTKTSAWSATRVFQTKAVYQVDQLESVVVSSDKETGDLFGIYVGLSADATRMVVGARTEDPSGLINAGSAYVFLRTGQTWSQEAKLTASDKVAGDLFSMEVAISGDGVRVFASTYLADVSGTVDAGAVYVFSRSGTTWSQETKLVSPTLYTTGYFGISFGISSDGVRVAVGCQGADISSVADTGAVYVFSRSGTTWSLESTLLATDRAASWFVGTSVKMTLDGTRVVAAGSPPGTAGAAYVWVRSGTTWSQEAKLVGSDAVVGDAFARSVYISGNGVRIAVGAYWAVINGYTQAGAIYVFVRSSGTWTQEAKLTSPTPAKNATFGQYVFMNADGSKIMANHSALDVVAQGLYPSGTAVPYVTFQRTGTAWAVGVLYYATGETSSNPGYYAAVMSEDGSYAAIGMIAADSGIVASCGTVYVYSQGLRPVPETILSGSDKASGDGMGSKVSFSTDGNRIAVTSIGSDITGSADAGAVYIYLRTNGVWAQEAKISASDKAANDNFGASVAMNGDGTRVVVGAWMATVGGTTQSGAAYVFLRTGTSWSQEAKLSASDKAANDQFGLVVAITSDATRVLVGANYADPGAVNGAGAAYVYLRTGTSWAQEQKLIASDPAAGANFARDVGFSADGVRAIMGANGVTVSSVSLAGAAYVFSRSGTTWTQEAKIVAADPATQNEFGISVALSSDGSRAVIGSFGSANGSATTAGAIYVFTRSGTTWTVEAKLIPLTANTAERVGRVARISNDGSRIIVGGEGKIVNGVTVGGAYVYRRSGVAWTQYWALLSSAPVSNDQFGFSTDISGDGTTYGVGAIGADIGGVSGSGAAFVYTNAIS